jgi:hypothetical protein
MRESGSIDYIVLSLILLIMNIKTFIYREIMSDKQVS